MKEKTGAVSSFLFPGCISCKMEALWRSRGAPEVRTCWPEDGPGTHGSCQRQGTSHLKHSSLPKRCLSSAPPLQCLLTQCRGISQHLHEASAHREISLGLPSNKDTVFRLCKIRIWRRGYSIQKYLGAEGWQQQMSDQGRRGHTSTVQSSRGLLGALTNALKYLEDNHELAQSLCHTHFRLI